MKRLTSLGLALLLATGGSAALADRSHGDDYRNDYRNNHRGGHGHGYRHGHHKDHWYPRPYYRNVYYSRPYYERNYYDPLGAALIGAAVTYSIFHAHDGGYATSRTNSEVVGCHRIERYPDGSERRVEAPLSECY